MICFSCCFLAAIRMPCLCQQALIDRGPFATRCAHTSCECVSQGLESLVNDVDRSHFRPLQRESFLCQARCCDSAQTQADLRDWCAAPSHSRVTCSAASHAWADFVFMQKYSCIMTSRMPMPCSPLCSDLAAGHSCDRCNATVEAAQQSVQAQLQAFTVRRLEHAPSSPVRPK